MRLVTGTDSAVSASFIGRRPSSSSGKNPRPVFRITHLTAREVRACVPHPATAPASSIGPNDDPWPPALRVCEPQQTQDLRGNGCGIGAKNSDVAKRQLWYRREMKKGPSRIRTGDGGFAIRCLSRLAKGPLGSRRRWGNHSGSKAACQWRPPPSSSTFRQGFCVLFRGFFAGFTRRASACPGPQCAAATPSAPR